MCRRAQLQEQQENQDTPQSGLYQADVLLAADGWAGGRCVVRHIALQVTKGGEQESRQRRHSREHAQEAHEHADAVIGTHPHHGPQDSSQRAAGRHAGLEHIVGQRGRQQGRYELRRPGQRPPHRKHTPLHIGGPEGPAETVYLPSFRRDITSWTG